MKSRFLRTLLVLLAAMPLTAQYQHALPGYQYQFPRDHFNHPDYQTEWWYYTGNLRSADGHKFGFELTFFRQGVSRGKAQTSRLGHSRHLHGAPRAQRLGRRSLL